MGINFIKQFVAAGMSKDIQLVVPLWGSDQDIIRAVGDPMLGLFSVGHWSIDFDNPANRRFVAEFEKEYKRLPTGYAASGYDTALLIDSAIRRVKGKIEDKDARRVQVQPQPVPDPELLLAGGRQGPWRSHHAQDARHGAHQPRRRLRRPVQDEVS